MQNETIIPEVTSVLLQQSPIIIVMGLIGYIMWRYIQEKNLLIKEKDERIMNNQNALIGLLERHVESMNRLTFVIEELRKDIERNNKVRNH